MPRPRKYATPELAAEAKQAQDKSRYMRDRSRVISDRARTIYEGLLPCCRDWVDAGSRNRRKCPQHRDWDQFIRQDSSRYRAPERHTNDDYLSHDKQVVADMRDEWVDASGRKRQGGFHVSKDPDTYPTYRVEDRPVDRLYHALFGKMTKRSGVDVDAWSGELSNDSEPNGIALKDIVGVGFSPELSLAVEVLYER